MSKWVEVTVKSTNTYLVELEDNQPEENAADEVINAITYDWDEIDQCVVSEEDAEDIKRHIDRDNIFTI